MMATAIGWLSEYTSRKSMRELIIAYESDQLLQWDHTSLLAANTYNLSVLVVNMMGKKKVRTRTAEHFHPYRQPKPVGAVITSKSIDTLRFFANAVVKNKGH